MLRAGLLASVVMLGLGSQAMAQEAGPPAPPASADAQAQPPSSLMVESPVEGGVHLTPRDSVKRDTDMIEELSSDANEEKRNLAAVMKFVDAEGGIYGAEKACYPHRAALFQRCAFLILDHWKLVYGRDLPKTQIKDGSRTEEIIVNTWGHVSDHSEAISRDAQSQCGEVDSAMQQSKIWKYCTEPNWSEIPEDQSGVTP